MPSDPSPDYSLKRLRDLCLHVHEENMAFLLRSTLAEFPIPVIDEFFIGPKINKPGGPDDREWTDLVRLIFIAFAPAGSEPSKLNGKPFGRYLREYPYDPDRSNADEVGTLTLYPTVCTTPLLAEIVAGLGVTTLRIQSKSWFAYYLANPFPIKNLFVRFGDRWHDATWSPIPSLQSDLSEVFPQLPESLEGFYLNVSPKLPLSSVDLSRLKSLKRLDLQVGSLPGGIDFSANPSLESVGLDIATGGVGSGVTGFSNLNSLSVLKIVCQKESIPVEAIGHLLGQRLRRLDLSGVVYRSETLSGCIPLECSLSRLSGLEEIRFTACEAISDESWGRVNLSGMDDLQSITLEGPVWGLEVADCSKLSAINARFTIDRWASLKIQRCPVLCAVEAVFKTKADEILLDDLPALSEVNLSATKVDGGTACAYIDSSFRESSAAFFMRKTGMIRPPVFTGGWRGLSIIELVENPVLESLEGTDALEDLAEIRIRKMRSIKRFLPEGSTATLPKVTWLRAEGLKLPAGAGFEAMPALSKLDLVSCSLDGLNGVESLECLETVDLSQSFVLSIAPLAGLPVLKSVRVSGCSGLRPKPPHVLLEGPELISELARAAGPDHPVSKNAPSEELTKFVQLIGEGKRSDVSKAVSLLHVLSPEEKEKMLAGAAIDPKTGWIRLPYFTKIKDEEAMGIPQLRILTAIGGAKADALLASVTGIVLNKDDDSNAGILRFGKKPEYGNYDDILGEFDSIGSLPAPPNVRTISINRVSRFSLQGLGKFSGLQKLTMSRVNHLEGVSELAGLASLNELRIDGAKLTDLTSLGSHPSLETLWLSDAVTTLEGLENFPKLAQLIISRVGDLAVLNRLSAEQGWKVSCKSSAISDGVQVFFTIERPKS